MTDPEHLVLLLALPHIEDENDGTRLLHHHQNRHRTLFSSILYFVSANTMAPTVLFFFKDDMKNTQLFAADGKLLYTVHTDKRSDSKTTVTRGETHASDSEEINPASPAVATIAHHELLPDTIQFGDAHATKLRGWLHGAKGKWTD